MTSLYRHQRKKKVAAEPESTPQKSKAQKDKQVLFVTTFDNMIIPNTIHNVNLRILRLWHGKLCGPNSLPSDCFIGVDEMGIKRECFVPPPLVQKWKATLVEDATYLITKISVTGPGRFNRLIDTEHQLRFTQDTRVQPAPDIYIALDNVYNQKKLDKVYEFLGSGEILRDSIVMVVDIRPTISRINPTKNVKFVEVCITDEKIFPRCCAITVWEEILKRNEFLSHGFKKQFVLLGSSLKLNEYRGKHGFRSTPFTRFTRP